MQIDKVVVVVAGQVVCYLEWSVVIWDGLNVSKRIFDRGFIVEINVNILKWNS